MIEVWGRRNSNNVMPVMWTLGELRLPHVRHNFGGTFGGLDSDDYLSLNPNGRIPTLRDRDCVVWESNAIVRYLAARFGEGNLWDADPGHRSLADRWMDWHKTTFPPKSPDRYEAISHQRRTPVRLFFTRAQLQTGTVRFAGARSRLRRCASSIALRLAYKPFRRR